MGMRMSHKQKQVMSQPHVFASSLSSLSNLDGQDHDIEFSEEQGITTNDRRKLQKKITRT